MDTTTEPGRTRGILVIYHRADFDGLFSREIARRKFGDEAEYLGWDYGDPVPPVAKDRELVMVDLCVDALMGHPQLTWIDHHISAMQIPGRAKVPGLRLDGVAACRLAWQYWFGNPAWTRADYVTRMVLEPWAVRLAGEYDVWDKRDPNAELLQHGLRTIDLDATGAWMLLLDYSDRANDIVMELLQAGRYVQFAARQADAAMIKANGFDLIFAGLKFLAVNAPRCNSLLFEAGLRADHDACLAFRWNGRAWDFSLYGAPHKPDVDLAAIAVSYGGGGHKQACGFRCDRMPVEIEAQVHGMECVNP